MFIVETEYLFVNLKWNQISETEDIKYREPIQIGIVAADEDLQKEKIFSKAIRLSDPTHINKGMLKLYRTTLENIMNANTKRRYIWAKLYAHFLHISILLHGTEKYTACLNIR